MNDDYFHAFEMGQTSERGMRAVAPEVFRGIYAMPTFVTIPTPDLEMSTRFWTRGLGFVVLFSVPGQVVHLRRWAYQDVLLVPSDAAAPDEAPAITVSFSCVLSQLDEIAEACAALSPTAVTGPRDTPWSTRDIEVITPERARVVCTAPRDVEQEDVERLASIGIDVPEAARGGDNAVHD